MAIPDYQSLMLPVAQALAADGECKATHLAHQDGGAIRCPQFVALGGLLYSAHRDDIEPKAGIWRA